jgi:hypothetical protein
MGQGGCRDVGNQRTDKRINQSQSIAYGSCFCILYRRNLHARLPFSSCFARLVLMYMGFLLSQSENIASNSSVKGYCSITILMNSERYIHGSLILLVLYCFYRMKNSRGVSKFSSATLKLSSAN